MAKLYFQHHYSSLHCHIIIHKSLWYVCCSENFFYSQC